MTVGTTPILFKSFKIFIIPEFLKSEQFSLKVAPNIKTFGFFLLMSLLKFFIIKFATLLLILCEVSIISGLSL